ncbi:hypothetical protein PR202_gb14251 [Eleusine coracana subsp. coracana]|uniref:Uncharacterized protein n=1 Tax=Eleusine coracana subsp. coracana TaxID=191504 RepID=A0AAV5EU62_ELECO|nr:hypothetical protein PR202_gb14251 [Eleusine coracana subsp. coracana]
MKVPDKFLHIRNKSFDQCTEECSKNCSCIAYAYANLSNAGSTGDTTRCLIWTGADLIDMGKAEFTESLYLRLAESPPAKKERNLLKILLPVIACLLLFTLTALAWTCKNRGKRQKKKVQKRMMLEYLKSMDEAGDKNLEFPFINFQDIVTATDKFCDSNMLGKGGFGKVYKGLLDGAKEVAIKRLSKGSGQGTQEFRNEVALIAKLQHKNLVKLLDPKRKLMLQWPIRCKIIQGIARGIMYLHQDSRLKIIHRDLKASNVLLDRDMSPKISDFGMARIFSGDQNQANTNRVVGTYGYMSPEYAMEGAFSVKSDTYSFGVLLLEINPVLKSANEIFSSLPHLCIQGMELMEGWPLMSAVVFMLENKTTPLPVPKQPVYFAHRNAEPEQASNKRVSSTNDVSLTTIEGR